MAVGQIAQDNKRHQKFLCDLCDVEPWERDEHEVKFGYPKHYLVVMYWDGNPTIEVHCAFCVWVNVAGGHEGQVIRVLR